LITSPEYDRIITLLKSFKLLRRHDIPDDQVNQLIMRDKKKSGSDIYFVLLDGIGKAIVDKIPVREAVDFYKQNKPGN
jgi:3-dehydroquinate synthetase